MANYPVPYQTPWNYSGALGQHMYTPYTQQQPTQQTTQTGQGLLWVDGEVGAKAYQLPVGWPANTPLALWDTNDTVIYLKSVNPMGMPNPLQKARYTLEEHRSASSGSVQTEPVPDMSDYVKKDDLESMKQELMETINSMSVSVSTRKPTVKEV